MRRTRQLGRLISRTCTAAFHDGSITPSRSLRTAVAASSSTNTPQQVRCRHLIDLLRMTASWAREWQTLHNHCHRITSRGGTAASAAGGRSRSALQQLRPPLFPNAHTPAVRRWSQVQESLATHPVDLQGDKAPAACCACMHAFTMHAARQVGLRRVAEALASLLAELC